MHKLSWLLNENLNFDFHRLDEENPSERKFAVYQHETEQATYSLIENKSNTEGLLIKKLPNIDFFLKIEGDISKTELEKIIKKIKEADNIYACLQIELSKLKKKDIELLS